MLFHNKLTMIAVLMVLLAGCNRDLEPPPLTAAERASLAGEDANKNGVRDDIEALILKTYSDKVYRAAIMRYARAEQATLMIDPADKAAVRDISFEIQEAQFCIMKKIPAYSHKEKIGREFHGLPIPKNPNQFQLEIRALTFDTALRKRAEIPRVVLNTSYSVPWNYDPPCNF